MYDDVEQGYDGCNSSYDYRDIAWNLAKHSSFRRVKPVTSYMYKVGKRLVIVHPNSATAIGSYLEDENDKDLALANKFVEAIYRE